METERLLLLPYNDNDIDFFESLLTSSDFMRYIGNGQARDEEGIQKLRDRIYSMYSCNPNWISAAND